MILELIWDHQVTLTLLLFSFGDGNGCDRGESNNPNVTHVINDLPIAGHRFTDLIGPLADWIVYWFYSHRSLDFP